MTHPNFTFGQGKAPLLVPIPVLSKLLHNETSRHCMFRRRRGKRLLTRRSASRTLHGGSRLNILIPFYLVYILSYKYHTFYFIMTREIYVQETLSRT
ncbi:hypothetical protein P692DRAFT_20197727 [Suillus brevipes Sb2]|nr:hypothetical protein P692DRAFT_20197727 [Suillus brevipes Sb2]